MDDDLRPEIVEQAEDSLRIDEIRLVESKAVVIAEKAEPVLFQPDVVVVVQIVNAANTIASAQERIGKMKSNEAGSALVDATHANVLTQRRRARDSVVAGQRSHLESSLSCIATPPEITDPLTSRSFLGIPHASKYRRDLARKPDHILHRLGSSNRDSSPSRVMVVGSS